MAENSLFQLAQVITDLPLHQDSPMTDSPRPDEVHHHHHHQQHQYQSNQNSRPLMPRKNACIVCAVCFTCSGYYGMNCNCCEAQPRRGKNLPQGGLDSRAKKLVPDDKDDYEFTLKWLDEFTNNIYRDREHNVVGLNDLTEVSLCKAHSSTLYRAKKRHQRNTLNQAPPSPADSNGTLMEENNNNNNNNSSSSSIINKRASSADPSYPVLPHPHHPHQQHQQHQQHPHHPHLQHHPYNNSSNNNNNNNTPVQNHFPNYQNSPPAPPPSMIVGGGALAAKVREISSCQQYRTSSHDQPELPDFSAMTASTSMKRKRTNTIKQEMPMDQQHPHPHHHIIHHKSSASTPLYAQNNNSSRMPPHPPVESFSSQLPPLHLNHPINSLSSSLQHQLHLSSTAIPSKIIVETVSLKSSTLLNKDEMMSSSTTGGTSGGVGSGLENNDEDEDIEDADEHSSHSSKNKKDGQVVQYYIRNLAITDNYTFKDLLSEIDFTGSPPPGKRIVISDANREKIYPMNQAIRNVIRYPTDSHVELCLDLAEKASIDWSKYT